MTTLFTCISSLFKNIIPILLTVAGEAYWRSEVSKMKFTLLPNDILSPVGSVNKWLSSSTEFKLSIHSGSISPSHIIQQRTSYDSLTTYLAAKVRTPSVNSRVSLFILPSSYYLFIDLGFMMKVLTYWFSFSWHFFKVFQMVVLPLPEGPTRTTPILYFVAS